MSESADRIRERLVKDGQRRHARDLGQAIRQIEPGTSRGRALAASPVGRQGGSGGGAVASVERGNTAWMCALRRTTPVTLGHEAGGEGDSGDGSQAPQILQFEEIAKSHAIDEGLLAFPLVGAFVPFTGIGSGHLELVFEAPMYAGTKVRIINQSGELIWPLNGAGYWEVDYNRLIGTKVVLSESWDDVPWGQGDVPQVEITPPDGNTVTVLEGVLATGMEGPQRITLPTKLLVQVRWWTNAGTEPESWHIEYLWEDPVLTGKIGVVGGGTTSGGRVCDWIGVGLGGGAAPLPADGFGTYTDFGEPEHTLNERPDGWNEAFGDGGAHRIQVQESALSTTPAGRLLRQPVGDATKAIRWTDGPTVTNGRVEVTAATGSQSDTDQALQILPVLDASGTGISVWVDVFTNQLRVATYAAGVGTTVATHSQSFSKNTLYRTRIRLTPVA